MNTVCSVCLFFLHSVNSFLVPDGLQLVNTQYGEIRGHLSSVQFDGRQYQVKSFLGIPYAEPPIGNFRFRKPVPKVKIPTPFQAFNYGPNCPGGNWDQQAPHSEDCLYLNVFVPTSFSSGFVSKPVMMWIAGDGFSTGSSDRFTPEVLCGYTDVIVVTVNYRLGPLGFFSTGDREAVGNYGLWDQHLAMQWVKGNVASFGGDPDKITIFGESSGGQSVVFQALYPGNRDVIKRAIAQSGTAAGSAVTHSDVVYKKSIEFAEALGCRGTDNAAIASCLRYKSSNEITAAVRRYMSKDFDDHPHWVPVFDNDFLKSDPLNILREASKNSPEFASYHTIDLLIGVNNLDGAVNFPYWMSQFNITNPVDFRVTQSQFKFVYVPKVAEIYLKETPSRLVRDEIIQEYTDWDQPNNDIVGLERLARLATDSLFYVPMILTANSHANTLSSTYVYNFHAAPPSRVASLPPSLDFEGNSNHADELPFLFGFNDIGPSFLGIGVTNKPRPSTNQMKLSKAVMIMWSNFAKSGNPNKPTDVKTLYDVEWQPYDRIQQRYLDISFNMNQQSMKARLAARAYNFWNTVLPAAQKATKH